MSALASNHDFQNQSLESEPEMACSELQLSTFSSNETFDLLFSLTTAM